MTDSWNGANHANGGARNETPSSTDRSDVRIEVFVGDTLLNASALHKLKSGDVLPMTASLADPVELRVSGLPVARGELVSVGDKFGVRIIEIA